MLNKIDNDVLLDVLDTAMGDTTLPISTPIENEVKEVNTTDKFINTVSPENYTRSVNKNYYNIENESVNNPMRDMLEYINGDRNIYMLNNYKGSIRNFYQQAYENEPNKARVADYVFTQTDYTYPYNRIKYYNLSPMVYSKVVDYLLADETRYNVKDNIKCEHKCDKECKTNIYNVYRLQPDLLKMFTHITKYWNEVKDKLTLDKNTGYYYYEVDKVKIPIICKHQAMILSNTPIQVISSQCYTNGVCKYCGQEIIAYNDGNEFVLPTSATSLIISFSEIFTHKHSSDTIIFDVNDYIVKRLQNMEVSSYSTDECVGWTCLFLIKLCQLGAKQFNVSDAKMKRLINKLSKNLSVLGKSEKDIDEFLKDSSLFEGIDNLIGLLISDGVINKQTLDDIEKRTNIVDEIVFNGKNKQPNTQLQKYYLANDGKIYEMFLAFKILLGQAYNTPFEHVIKDVINNVEHEDIKNIVNTFGYDFFTKSANIYCPINYCHEWISIDEKQKTSSSSGKQTTKTLGGDTNNKQQVCKHCGLYKNMSNIDEIYNKYSSLINNINTEEPMLIKEDYKIDNTKEDTIINNIKKTDYKIFNETIKKYVDYEDMVKLETLTKTQSREYLELVSTTLNIDVNTLRDKLNQPDDMKRLFCYLVEKQGEDIATNNIICCLLPVINPLDYLVKD